MAELQNCSRMTMLTVLYFVQYLLTLVDLHSRKEKICESVQSDEGKWSMALHLLGCCHTVQAQVLHGSLKDKKVSEAIRCFYR